MKILTILVFIILIGTQSSFAGSELLYPRFVWSNDKRDQYPLRVLELVLQKAKTNYHLTPTKIEMLQSRSLAALADGKGEVDIVWSMTSKEREQNLRPIRIPIDKGLMGWRIFLVRSSEINKFKQISDLASLQKLVAGQGHDWPDTEILKSDGFNVLPAPSYSGLFNMLATNRYDYFPRAVGEIFGEYKAHKDLNLVVEESLAIYYPTASYFFVNKNNEALAVQIEKGFKIAIEDGSFDKLFWKFNGEAIKQAKLHERRIFEVANPHLSSETPIGIEKYWYHPKMRLPASKKK